MAQIIEVVVRPDGATTVQTKGYTGAGCVSASRFIEEALGLATAERKTAEFHHEPVERQTLQH